MRCAWVPRGSGAGTLEGPGTITKQGLDDEGDCPEGGKLPATALGGEEEASRAVGRIDGAEQDRHQEQRYPACPEAGDEREAACQFRGDDEVGKKTGKAEALEVGRRARRRKDHQ